MGTWTEVLVHTWTRMHSYIRVCVRSALGMHTNPPPPTKACKHCHQPLASHSLDWQPFIHSLTHRWADQHAYACAYDSRKMCIPSFTHTKKEYFYTCPVRTHLCRPHEAPHAHCYCDIKAYVACHCVLQILFAGTLG